MNCLCLKINDTYCHLLTDIFLSDTLFVKQGCKMKVRKALHIQTEEVDFIEFTGTLTSVNEVKEFLKLKYAPIRILDDKFIFQIPSNGIYPIDPPAYPGDFIIRKKVMGNTKVYPCSPKKFKKYYKEKK